MKYCPICGESIKHTTKSMAYNYKGGSITLEQPCEYCNSCNESFLSKEDINATKKELADFKRGIDHLLKTSEIKRIRNKIHLTQKEAADLFGGGVRAFHKYETGENSQNKPLDILLRLIDQNKISIDDIKKVAC